MNSDAATTAFVARFPVAAMSALRLTDALADALAGEAAVSAFQVADGSWTIEIHLPHAPDRAQIAALVADWAGAQSAEQLVFATVKARDWVAASLEGLAPVRAGRFVVHGRHDRHRVKPNERGIEIEAGLAFGTGHHGTTRGCLLVLHRVAQARKSRPGAPRRPIRVLDIGTGSGVLAIAARKTIPCRVVASDIDPQAICVARENVRLNGVADGMRLVAADGLGARAFRESRPFDLVFANILLEPLKSIALAMTRLVRHGAIIVLSGLLPKQANAAMAAYRMHGFVVRRRILLDGWTTLELAYAGGRRLERPRRGSGALSDRAGRNISR